MRRNFTIINVRVNARYAQIFAEYCDVLVVDGGNGVRRGGRWRTAGLAGLAGHDGAAACDSVPSGRLSVIGRIFVRVCVDVCELRATRIYIRFYYRFWQTFRGGGGQTAKQTTDVLLCRCGQPDVSECVSACLSVCVRSAPVYRCVIAVATSARAHACSYILKWTCFNIQMF